MRSRRTNAPEICLVGVVLTAIVARTTIARADPPPRLVDANTEGRVASAFGPGAEPADQLHLTFLAGCLFSRLAFEVSGDADGAGEGRFAVDFALYDGCPLRGGSVIAGTAGRAEFPDDGNHWVSFEPTIDAEIPLPAVVWIGLTFDRAHAGWIGGAPALVGYSDDHYADPLYFSCQMSLGLGFPGIPHGSFNARVYVREPCAARFLAFRGSSRLVGTYSPGSGLRFAEDVRLNVPNCSLTGYEIALRGSGSWEFDVRLPDPKQDGLPGAIVPGSAFSFNSFGNALQFARFTLDPPTAVPDSLWVTMSGVGIGARVGVTIFPPQVGGTNLTHAVLDVEGWRQAAPPPSFPAPVFQVSVTCAGQAPGGACCDMVLLDETGESLCRDVPEINCPFPPRGSTLLPMWKQGASCNASPFDPPCGAAACCHADGVCENVTHNECGANGVSWSRGVYCDSPDVYCEFICVRSLGPCTLAHPDMGCVDPYCCRAVCAQTSQLFCCQVEWDNECAVVASEVCDIPPSNDECSPGPGGEGGAVLLTVPSQTESDGVHATENESDPGFCCHAQAYGAKGVATVWYKFVAPGTSVQIDTCRSVAPAEDSLIQVFALGDPSTPTSACATLQPIGCNDDAALCSSSQTNSRFCLHDLTPGALYYLLVAAKNEAVKDNYRVNITALCSTATPRCPCPTGEATFLDPPPGVIDARRPTPPDDPATALGPRAVTVIAPPLANRPDCWPLCESRVENGANAIADFALNRNGTMTLTLARPMSAGAATTVVFRDGSGVPWRGEFTSHPGNVNGDAFADADDTLALLAGISDPFLLPWGEYSGDVDRSGKVSPLDVLETINLLLGAEAYAPWNHTPKPMAGATCP